MSTIMPTTLMSRLPSMAVTAREAAAAAFIIAIPPMLGVPVFERCDWGPSSLTNCLNCFFSKKGISIFVNKAPKTHAAIIAITG